MAVTQYKGYPLIVTGDEVDTWGDVLNADAWAVIDKNLGGLVSKSLTNVNVTLTADENENLILRLTGTLTGAVLITTTLQGMMIVENLTTGSFAVTFTNGVGSAITIPQSARSLIVADATNGARLVNEPIFPSGTRMLFHQTAAPTGWTKDASAYNHALRLVGGTVGSGGSAAFTTAFASQAVSGTVGNTTLTEAQIPAHTHGFTASVTDGNGPTGSGATRAQTTSASTTQSTGGGQSHTHTFTGNAINLAVQYVDVIIAQKD
jgi:microcystin-dependent protein